MSNTEEKETLFQKPVRVRIYNNDPGRDYQIEFTAPCMDGNVIHKLTPQHVVSFENSCSFHDHDVCGYILPYVKGKFREADKVYFKAQNPEIGMPTFGLGMSHDGCHMYEIHEYQTLDWSSHKQALSLSVTRKADFIGEPKEYTVSINWFDETV